MLQLQLHVCRKTSRSIQKSDLYPRADWLQKANFRSYSSCFLATSGVEVHGRFGATTAKNPIELARGRRPVHHEHKKKICAECRRLQICVDSAYLSAELEI